jgi:transposase
MQVDTDEGEIIERVAALDVGKAEVVCCVRLPGPGGQRFTTARGLPSHLHRKEPAAEYGS